MADKFAGKVAIVTGAAKGIGFACAQSLGKRGAKVVVADLDIQAAKDAVVKLSEAGITSHAVHVDVSKKIQVYPLRQLAVSGDV